MSNPIAIPCSTLASSIRPISIVPLISTSAFDDLMNCLVTDLSRFAATNSSPSANLVVHHKSVVDSSLARVQLPLYEEKLKRFRKISEYRSRGGLQNMLACISKVQ